MAINGPGIVEVEALKNIFVLGGTGLYVGKVFFERTHTWVNSDGIVIQHDQCINIGHPEMVETLEGHTTGNGGIADHGNMLFGMVAF